MELLVYALEKSFVINRLGKGKIITERYGKIVSLRGRYGTWWNFTFGKMDQDCWWYVKSLSNFQPFDSVVFGFVVYISNKGF